MKAFIKRLMYAVNGLTAFFGKETNGQIQLFIASAVVVAGFILRINKTEWVAVAGCIGLVLALEMVNSAIEKLCDHLHPQKHDAIAFIKDVAAGAVLWAAIFASIAGLIIFLPKVMSRL